MRYVLLIALLCISMPVMAEEPEPLVMMAGSMLTLGVGAGETTAAPAETYHLLTPGADVLLGPDGNNIDVFP
jgi:hypothetical protein